MTDRKIIRWLTLKELPGIPAFTKSESINDCGNPNFSCVANGAFLGLVSYLASLHTDFFLPIYEGEEVCPKCKGRATIPYKGSDICCSMCNGSHKVAVKKERLTCDVCNGSGMISASPMTGVYMERGCQKCDGTGKIIKSEKSKCKKCGGERSIVCGGSHAITCPSCNGTGTQDWEWPPVKGQRIFYIAMNGEIIGFVPRDIYAEHVITNIGQTIYLLNCFPTREMTEDYLKRRKELGI